MSTQLVLYPQSHKGYSSNFSGGPAVEYIVDGINFTGLNSAVSVTTGYGILWSSVLYQLVYLTGTPVPLIVNTWYRTRAFAGQDYPTEVSNNAVLDAIAGATTEQSSNYIIQKLSSLTIGLEYKVTVNCQAANQSSRIMIYCVKGTGTSQLIANTPTTQANTTSVELIFAAESTEDIIMVAFFSNYTVPVDDTLIIESVSVKEAIVSPTGVYTNLQDGQVICDLYKEEDIPLTLSMDEFKNVAEQVKSYSKDFNLPATKRNNQIFNNMFEVTRTDDGLIFNPQVVTKCVLKQDGFIIFDGFLRMTDVKDKEGEISYNVNLYSEVVALAEVLGDRTFGDLSFSELEHDYTINNIEDSWESIGAGNGLVLTNPLPTTSLAYDSVTGVNNTQVLKYPYVDWNHQIYGYTAGPTLVNLEVAFRPFIQLKYLINKIFAATNQFSYTSAFFDEPEFEKLFMDFNWGGNENGSSNTYAGTNDRYFDLFPGYWVPSSWTAVPFPDSVSGSSALWTNVTNRFTSPVHNLNFTCLLGKIEAVCVVPGYISMQFVHYDQYGNFIQNFGYKKVLMASGFTATMTTSFSTVMGVGDYIQGETDKTPVGEFQVLNSSRFFMLWSSIGQQTSNLLTETRGELGQWEFLKGIMTMFNLVSTVDKDDPNNILIEPYADVFINTTKGLSLAARSILHDWTDKVDVSEMELKPLTDLEKTTIFQFAEDENDYIAGVMSVDQGSLYGSQSINAAVAASNLNTVFKGKKEITAEPFAASAVAPLENNYLDFIVPRIYKRNEDGENESFDNAPRILYNNGIKTLNTHTYKGPAQNGGGAYTLDKFLQFSHLSDIPTVSPTTINYYFDSHQLPAQVGAPPVNDLYYNYWAPYIEELYNADTRIMTLKVNLSSSDIANFKFYDTVMIKNRSFRVNYINYKPNSLSKVEFILLP